MDLNSRVLIKDNEIFKTTDINELKAIIEYRKKNDNILIADVSDLKLVHRFKDETTAEFKTRVNAAIPVEEIEAHIVSGNGLFLDFNTEVNGKMRHGVLPVRDIALNSIFERARCNCFTISNFEAGQDYQVMPLETKIAFVNNAFKLYGGKAKVLYRDRKVTSVMSGQYYHISYESMDNGLNALKDDFPDIAFEEASVSHEFFKETYSLNSDEVEEDIALAMSDAGRPVDKVSVTISAYTSDHGKVAATFYGKIKLDDKSILFGSPESVKHAGKKSEAIVKEAAKKLYTSFKENEERIKALPTISINHPAGCFRLICKEFHMPKKQACVIADNLEGRKGVTAYEIYFLLNELVADVEESGKDPIRTMVLQDEVARVLRADFKKYDKEFLWSRGEAV